MYDPSLYLFLCLSVSVFLYQSPSFSHLHSGCLPVREKYPGLCSYSTSTVLIYSAGAARSACRQAPSDPPARVLHERCLVPCSSRMRASTCPLSDRAPRLLLCRAPCPCHRQCEDQQHVRRCLLSHPASPRLSPACHGPCLSWSSPSTDRPCSAPMPHPPMPSQAHRPPGAPQAVFRPPLPPGPPPE
jgi:hypothetical protein